MPVNVDTGATGRRLVVALSGAACDDEEEDDHSDVDDRPRRPPCDGSTLLVGR